jgi:hypothetical protein
MYTTHILVFETNSEIKHNLRISTHSYHLVQLPHISIVFIVRGSAGRFLLVYLSARRLRSSGYYSKYQNGDLSSGF